MENAFKTPLLDVFRRGEAPVDLRLLAAQGVLAPRAHEQMELLMLLVKDADPGVAAAAEATLQSIPAETLSAFLARSDVPVTVFARGRQSTLERYVVPASVAGIAALILAAE